MDSRHPDAPSKRPTPLNAQPVATDEPLTQTAGAPAFPRPAAVATWGDLRIVEELGRGAFGCVYRAFDATLARDVALKIIPVESSDPAATAAVLREGRMLARVHHRNVVTVYRAQQIEAEIGVAMELVRGRSLASLLRESGPLAADEAAVIGISLCHALSAVHGAGLLHRDVKAHNVMRESGGRIVLMDFGAGREIAARQTGWRDMAGTPVYMAPEVLAGAPWSASADLYSLGVLLFYLVSGRHPIEGATVPDLAIAHARGQRSLLADCRPDLPEAFVRVVERALAPTVAQRYHTAGEMLQDLSSAVASAGWRDGAIERDLRAPRVRGGWSSPPVRWTTIAAAALGFVWLLGLLTSLAFDQTLGRDAGFANESAVDGLIWGVRSLLAPVLLGAVVLIAAVVVRFLWHLALHLAPPLARAAGRVRAAASRLTSAAGLADRTSRAQLLLVIQAGGLAAIVWGFWDLISACASFANTAAADTLAPLRPDVDGPPLFRVILSVAVVAMSAAWYRLLVRRDDGARVDRPTAAAGVALVIVATILLSVPYRLIAQAEFQRVDFAGQRCYETGQRGTERLLFCPDAIPRNHIVLSSDSRLRRLPAIENIFTPAWLSAR